jgi:hypothetical protein
MIIRDFQRRSSTWQKLPADVYAVPFGMKSKASRSELPTAIATIAAKQQAQPMPPIYFFRKTK